MKIVSFIELPKVEDTKSKGYLDENEQPMALLGSQGCLRIKTLDPTSGEYDTKTAYLYDGFFYRYMGPQIRELATEPGIYWDKKNQTYYLVECDPENSEHVRTYRADAEHIAKLNPILMAEDLEKNEEAIYAKQKAVSTKTFIPEVQENDKLLKRILKMAIREKGINIDECQNQFPDKNARFNFKSVMRSSTSQLSWLLFERGCEAFNLRYAIVISDADPDHVVGDPLKKPLVVSSDDTFSMSIGDMDEVPVANPDNVTDSEEE